MTMRSPFSILEVTFRGRMFRFKLKIKTTLLKIVFLKLKEQYLISLSK